MLYAERSQLANGRFIFTRQTREWYYEYKYVQTNVKLFLYVWKYKVLQVFDCLRSEQLCVVQLFTCHRHIGKRPGQAMTNPPVTLSEEIMTDVITLTVIFLQAIFSSVLSVFHSHILLILHTQTTCSPCVQALLHKKIKSPLQ